MSKHTAGPWFVEDNPTIFPAVQVAGFEDSGNRHLQVAIYSNSQEEDARLIAAAPDLLEALECMLIGAGAVAIPHNGERAVLQEAVNIARAAITKATGEAR